MTEYICEKTQTLKEFTENNYAQGSFFWNILLKNKDIKVNGERVGKDVLLCKGDKISYYLTKKQEEKPAFFPVYEDENILIVDKESGVNSEAVFASLQRERACYFIHRLDRNTQGLLVFALNERAETELLQAFKNRTAEKKYRALCFGTFKKGTDILTAYLKKDANNAIVRIYGEQVRGSEQIITEYRVLETDGETSELEILLHTGKTHQIRAHFAYIGHPIVGDMKYGYVDKNKAYQATRQRLVAKSLRFSFKGNLSYLNGQVFLSRFDVKRLTETE